MPLAATVANAERKFDPNNQEDIQAIQAAQAKLDKALAQLKKVDAAIVASAPVVAWGCVPVLNWFLPTFVWGAAVATCGFAVGNRAQATEKYTEALTEAIELYTFCMQQDAHAALRCYAIQNLMQSLAPLMAKTDFCLWQPADLGAQNFIAGGDSFFQQVKGTVANATSRVREHESTYHQLSHEAVKSSVVKLIATNDRGAHLLTVEYRLYGQNQFSADPKEGLKSLALYTVGRARPYAEQATQMATQYMRLPTIGGSR